MRYPKDHKARTRERIVAAGRAVFAEIGYEQATIDDVMARAGLTRGGFYAHFAGKEALFAEAILTGVLTGPTPYADYRGHTDSEFEAMVASYVGDTHFHDKTISCPLIAFPGDVARGGPVLRGAYEQVARSIATALGDQIGDTIDGPDRDGRALATLAMIVGAMVIARGVESPDLERAVRAACVEHAKTLATP